MPHRSSMRGNIPQVLASGPFQHTQGYDIQVHLGSWIRPNASDDASSLRTTPSIIEKNRSTSFESPNDVAVASLLLHAKAKQQLGESQDFEECLDSPSIKMPLKKRIKATEDACQLSPLSHITKVTYLSDEASRQHATHAITVKIDNFPTVLHQVLTQSEYAGNVMQWLPHGKSFRIVRFDALRKNVIPKYFPQLNHGNGSMNAFLAQLQAWGFHEIAQGADAGAHYHKLFRQSLPQLAADITYQPPLLQVPSLLSSASKDTDSVVVRTPAGWPTWTSPVQVPPYSPVQVRSTRGRHGMTVSNRGKKSSGPRRISLPVVGLSPS